MYSNISILAMMPVVLQVMSTMMARLKMMTMRGIGVTLVIVVRLVMTDMLMIMALLVMMVFLIPVYLFRSEK